MVGSPRHGGLRNDFIEWGYPSFSNPLGPILVTNLGRDVTSVYEHRVLQFDPALERKSDLSMPVLSKRESKGLATCHLSSAMLYS